VEVVVTGSARVAYYRLDDPRSLYEKPSGTVGVKAVDLTTDCKRAIKRGLQTVP
jgi:hypothetical protein